MFRHIWKLCITLNCNSIYCPKPYSETHPVILNFQPLPHKSFLAQIKSQFPSLREVPDTVGLNYYVPDNNILHGLNSKEDIISKQSIKYECWGVLIVQNANLASGSPWIILFCISSFKSESAYRIVAHITWQKVQTSWIYAAYECSLHYCYILAWVKVLLWWFTVIKFNMFEVIKSSRHTQQEG